MFDSVAAALNALWGKRTSINNDPKSQDYSFGNNTPLKWRNAADTADVSAINVDADGP